MNDQEERRSSTADDTAIAAAAEVWRQRCDYSIGEVDAAVRVLMAADMLAEVIEGRYRG